MYYVSKQMAGISADALRENHTDSPTLILRIYPVLIMHEKNA